MLKNETNYFSVNGDYIYNMDFTFAKRKQKDYLKITNHNITFTTTRAYYYFENLFNGDPRLGAKFILIISTENTNFYRNFR